MREWFTNAGGDMAPYAEQPADEWPTIFQAQLDERLELETRLRSGARSNSP